MFEQERIWLDEETKRWNALCLTWGVATSGRTEQKAFQNLELIRKAHIEHCVPKQ